MPVIAGMVSCPAALAKMGPKEILAAADEARGNVEGVIWDVEIESTENGRNQKRRMRIKAKGYNVLAEIYVAKAGEGPENSNDRPEHVVYQTGPAKNRFPFHHAKN